MPFDIECEPVNNALPFLLKQETVDGTKFTLTLNVEIRKAS